MSVNTVLGYFVLGVMTLMALALMSELFIPSAKVLAARDWQSLPVTLHDFKMTSGFSGKVGSRPSSNYSAYLDVDYSYAYDGRTYRSKRLEFGWIKGDATPERKREQLRRLKAGEALAYVNPENPDESVLDRSLDARATVVNLLFLLFPAGFGTIVLVGFLLWPFRLNTHYLMPAMGVLHGGLPLSFLILHRAAFSTGQTTILMLMSLLLVAGVAAIMVRLVRRR